MTRYRLEAVRTLRPQPAPAGLYASKYTPDLGALICARLAAGESLRSICRSDTSMPTEKTVWNWARSHPEFAALRVRALLYARAQTRGRHARAASAKRSRRSKTGRVAWNRGQSVYGPELSEAVCARLCVGEPLYKVCRLPGMPSLGTVYTWLRTRPDFLEAYRNAKRVAFLAVMDAAMDRARERETEAASMRELRQLEKIGLRRCAWLAPTVYGDAVYGPLN
jgi:hypothetical protein